MVEVGKGMGKSKAVGWWREGREGRGKEGEGEGEGGGLRWWFGDQGRRVIL